jgi:hypothetical protein
MDGRVVTGLVTLGLPTVLLGVTVWKFGSNPLAILGLIVVMIAGVMYLLTYSDSF